MAFNYLAGGACVVFALAFLLAVMTWRRSLSRWSLILTLTAIALSMFSGRVYYWVAVFSASTCIFGFALYLIEALDQVRQARRHRLLLHGATR
jgi:hypothetical protein